MDLGSQLRALRGVKWKQQVVADEAGMPRQRLSKIENGLISPTVAELQAILRVYGKTVKEVLGGIASTYSNPDHAVLHDKLQAVIEHAEPGRAEWLAGNIQVFYDDAMRPKRFTSLQSKKVKPKPRHRVPA